MSRDRILNLLLVIFGVILIVIVVYRFILPGDVETGALFQIEDFNEITVNNINGTLLSFPSVLSIKSDFFLKICDFKDCFSCIRKGVDDLIKLRDSGYETAIFVKSDNLKDVQGWTSANFPGYSNFYLISTATFYSKIKSHSTPVIVRFKDQKIIGTRFINP